MKISKKYHQYLENTVIALLLATIASVFINVVLRYVFNNSSIGLQELQWHLFSSMFLLGIAYTLQHDAHVRVDILYTNFTPKTQALINIIGCLLFIVPISLIIIYYGIDFAYSAYVINEQSGDPGGLTHRFIIKSIIPLSSILLILASTTFIKNNYEALK